MLALLWLSLTSPALARDPDLLSVQPRHVHLSLGSEPGSLTVSWSTINKTEESVVVVYDGETRTESSFNGSAQLFVDGGKMRASQWIHKVSVSGLRGNSTYRYLVGSRLGWSDVMLVRTVPSGNQWSPNIVMFGDMGNDNAVSLPWIQRETEEGGWWLTGRCFYNVLSWKVSTMQSFMLVTWPTIWQSLTAIGEMSLWSR